LDVKLLHGEQARVWHKTLKDRQSLQFFYKGVDEFFKMQKSSNARARELFEAVTERQPNVSIGATWAALCHWFDAFKGWSRDTSASLELAGHWAQKAVVMEDADGQAHMVLSHVHLLERRFDDALIVGREAVALRPNCTNANGFFGNVLHYCGEQNDAINHVTWAIRYSPVYPPLFADILALAYLLSDENLAAIALASESLRINPTGTTARLVLAAAHLDLGNLDEARSFGAEVLSADLHFTLGAFAKLQPYRNEADNRNFVAKLREAGLPD
jgi:tetratricopeptide (TPR) repeat protein